MEHNNILGTVLAGGKSQRFGEDKSQVKLGDKLLIDYILTEIIDEFNEVLVVSNNPINFKESEKISLIKDFKKDLGPLGGVLTAMKWVKDNKKDYQWISTFLSPLFKSSSNLSIKSIDQSPNILCLVLFDLIKKSLPSSIFIFFKKFFSIWFVKKGVSAGKVDIH